jgi:stage II sporulation protein D
MIYGNKSRIVRKNSVQYQTNEKVRTIMKTFCRRAIAAGIALALLLSSSTIAMGQYQTPSYIRVGLYYKDSTVNTALAIFDVSAAAGLQAGFFANETFTEIYREPSSATLYARKDTYFYNASGTLKEYSPSTTSSDSLGSAVRYGPYHIKIGSDSPDQATAATQVAAYRQAGVQAYIAYDDAWQVWTGCFPDEAAAQANVAAITPMLGEIGYTVLQPASNRIVLTDAQYQPLCIFGSKTAYFQLRPAPESNPPAIKIKTKLYRGALEVRRLAASDMTVINYVSITEYLYGNVPAEIGGKSPAEAIKAQAIAAKMYALNNIGKHGKTGFDVCPTTCCQVYKGYSYEVASCNEAINQVKDLVITYNGKLANSIFYFSSSGGRTEDVQNVWGSTVPYLVSVEDRYETIYNWTKTLHASDIKAKIPQLGNILGVSITQTAQSGRVTQLSVRGDNRSDPLTYLREKCKTLFGLDSQLYTITSDADVYTAAFSHIPAAVALIPVNPPAIIIADNSAAGNASTGNASAGGAANMVQTSATTAPGVSAEEYDRLLAKQIAMANSTDSAQTTPTDVILADAIANAASSTGASGSTSPANPTETTGSASAAGSTGTTDMSAVAGTATDSSYTNGANAGVLNTPNSSNTSSSAISSQAALSTSAAMRLSIPMPVTAAASKTQLGGMKVVSAGGMSTLKAPNNKMTVLGAGGAVRTATLVPETYTFTGKGWGHAVGLSQMGAIGMGKAGIPFDQILLHYFQGTKIEQG